MTDNAMREQARTLALCQGFPASAHRIACLNMKFNFINVSCPPKKNKNTKQNNGARDPPTYLDRRPGPDLKNKNHTKRLQNPICMSPRRCQTDTRPITRALPQPAPTLHTYNLLVRTLPGGGLGSCDP